MKLRPTIDINTGSKNKTLCTKTCKHLGREHVMSDVFCQLFRKYLKQSQSIGSDGKNIDECWEYEFFRCKQCLDSELHIDKCCVCKRKVVRHKNDFVTWTEKWDFTGTVCEACDKVICMDCCFSSEDADLCPKCFKEVKEE